jgi:DNA-binding transcriptional MerR regulator
MSRIYLIRELTKGLGITARTLRHYEDEGLIAPARRGQSRLYSARDRARITLVLRGRRVGFSLAEIREILDLYDAGDGGTAQLAHAKKKFAERITVLEAQKKDIEESVAELKLGLEMIETRLTEHHAYERWPDRVGITGYGLVSAED